jgi:BNR repeat-like domain
MRHCVKRSTNTAFLLVVTLAAMSGLTAYAQQASPSRPEPAATAAPRFDWNERARRPLAPSEPSTRRLFLPTRTLASSGYSHYSTIGRTPDGRLHLFSYFGQQHQGGKESAIAYRLSSDGGVSWSAPRMILDGNGGGIDWRIGATGVTATGRIIVTAVRGDLATRTGILGSIHSDDGGATWSGFSPLRQIASTPFSSRRSQILTNSQIKVTPSGRLVMMSYIGNFNFLHTSTDNGQTWQRDLMVQSSRPDFSEIAVQPIDDLNWIAVSRVDRQRSGMAQFVTRDGGQTWQNLGPLNLTIKAAYVAPTLDLVQSRDGKTLILGFTDRSTGEAMVMTAPADVALADPGRWRGPYAVASGMRVRSGYQTSVVDPTCNRSVLVNHWEVSEFDTEMKVMLLPLHDIVTNVPAPPSGGRCQVFRP